MKLLNLLNKQDATKFGAVSRGLQQTNPQNLEKFAAENCVPDNHYITLSELLQSVIF